MTVTQWFLTQLSAVLVPRADREVVVGDLLELHALRAERRGWLRATARALLDVVGSGWSSRTGRGPAWKRPGSTRPRRTPVADAFRDLGLALRSVVREKGFSTVAVLTLAVGVGATATVFGMLNQLVLRPLPGTTAPHDAAYLRLLDREAPDPWNGMGLTTLDFDVLRAGADFTTGLAGTGNARLQVAIGSERPRSVWANTIYGDYFEVLGVRPAEGRLLSGAETALGADPLVAVIGWELRNELFGRDETVVGRSVVINGVGVRIVGVAVRGFQGSQRHAGAEMWLPFPSLVPVLGFDEQMLVERRSTMHEDLLVRLRPGWTAEHAESRISALLASIAADVPESAERLARMEPTLFPGLTTRPGARASVSRTLQVLAGVVGMVLLLACANVANLFLFRNVTRRGHAAVRRALGASPGSIVRGELLHSLVIGALGSAAGLMVAWLISLLLRGEAFAGMPQTEALVIDLRVLGYALAMAFVTAALFGAIPALLAGRFDLRGALQAAGRGDTGRVARLRSAMASVQIGLSLALLVSGVMLVRTLSNLYAVDTGLTLDRVAVLPIQFARGFDDADAQAARERIELAVEALPGVERATHGMYDPLGGARLMGRIARTEDGLENLVRGEMVGVSASWFDALGVRSLDGTPLRIRDEQWGPGNAVLTEGMARRLFGDPASAIGRGVLAGFRRTPGESRVIAVTADLRAPNDPDIPREAFFLPFTESPISATTLLLRASTLDPATLRSVRTAVEGVITDVPVADAQPLGDRLDRMHAEERLFSRLLALLSAFALLLAAVGLYGVVAFTVAGRRREFGVRIAVGAGTWRIARLVLLYAGSIVIAGSALGLAGGYALSRLMESRLYGVAPADPSSYLVAAAVLAATAAVACWLPTRSAMRVDPVTALRSE